MDKFPESGSPQDPAPNIDLTKKPTVPLFTFLSTRSSGGIRIIQRIGTKYRDLGALLLNDSDGTKTEIVVQSHPQQPEEITRDILVRWLNEGGRVPVTWATFITVLKEMDLKQLARDLEIQAGIDIALQPRGQPGSDSVDGTLMTSTDLSFCSIGLVNSIDDLSKMIKELKKQFQSLKKTIKGCLEKQNISVDEIADALTSLSPDDDDCHKIFLESHVKELDKAENPSQLFLTMNSHWNYLDPSLLDHLVDELELEDDNVSEKMKAYNSELTGFRKKTPLKLFCKTQKKRHVEIPSNFKKMVAKFEWPQAVMTLENAEDFREKYAHHYSLHECAMMLVEVNTGSFTITWLIPVSIVDKLRQNVPSEILMQFNVVQLIIAGTCVFHAENEVINADHIVHNESYAMFLEDELSSDEDISDTSHVDYAVTETPKSSCKTVDTPLAGQGASAKEVERTPIGESDFESASLKNDLQTGVAELGGTSVDDLESKKVLVRAPDPNVTGSIPLIDKMEEKAMSHTGKHTTDKGATNSHASEDSTSSLSVESVSQATVDTPTLPKSKETLISPQDTRILADAPPPSKMDRPIPHKRRHIPVPNKRKNIIAIKSGEEGTQDLVVEKDHETHNTMEDVVYRAVFPTSSESSSSDEDSVEPNIVVNPEIERPEAPLRRYHKIQIKIRHFKRRFGGLKKSVRDSLNEQEIEVPTVTNTLRSLTADDAGEHKLFTDNRMELIDQAMDHSEVIGNLGFNMDFLSYHILEVFAHELNLEGVELQLEDYKKALQKSLMPIPLTLFARAHRGKQIKLLPPEFHEIVVEFQCPTDKTKNLTLDTLHNFQHQYMAHLKLKDYTLIFGGIRPGSSFFTCTWYFPRSIAGILSKAPKDLLDKYSITMLRVAGTCIYRKMKQEDSDYPFVEEPADDFICPVLMNLLLQPHQTTCCGKHICEEAATKIQREKGKCPLCKESKWNSVLDKAMRRKVMDLRVFCHNEHEGCRWQGELRDFDSHVSRCSTRCSKKIPKPTPRPILKKYPSTSAKNTTPNTIEARGQDPCCCEGPAQAKETLNLKQLTVQCHPRKPAPCGIVRGSVTSDGRYAFLTSLGSAMLYRYEYRTERWEQLPPCPHQKSGLAILKGELTTLGGWDKSGWTKKLMTLRGKEWVEEYPQMKTGCSHPTVAVGAEGDYHFVIGGYVGVENRTSTCELFHVKSRNWYKTTDLPKRLHYPSTTICGGRLFVIGDGSTGYSCVLPALPSINQAITLPLAWEPLPLLPVTKSTTSNLFGCLLILGGIRNGSSVDTIHQLVDEQWVKIGSMNNSTWLTQAVNLSPKALLIVGGGSGARNNVEHCIVKASCS